VHGAGDAVHLLHAHALAVLDGALGAVLDGLQDALAFLLDGLRPAAAASCFTVPAAWLAAALASAAAARRSCLADWTVGSLLMEPPEAGGDPVGGVRTIAHGAAPFGLA
jgi:hypothetical protein